LVSFTVEPLFEVSLQFDDIVRLSIELHIVQHDIFLVSKLTDERREGQFSEKIFLFERRRVNASAHSFNEYIIIRFDDRTLKKRL
jgi:hypothetical protein